VFIHDTLPPGAAAMSKLAEQIRYRYQERQIAAGESKSPSRALQAVHAFFRLQISDQQTGDSTSISSQ
jgi:hypothetical protein